jgi:hypothetical protein
VRLEGTLQSSRISDGGIRIGAHDVTASPLHPINVSGA